MVKRSKTKRVPKPRNPVARSPLLGKGGAHGKTTAARRRRANVELADVLAKIKRDPDQVE